MMFRIDQPFSRSFGKAAAVRFVVLLGLVSLFADMTYEGARSINGPYLGTLGASATVVGVVSGLGELVGYGVRLLSGWLGDRTQRYWAITIAGYVLNLFAVPLLAVAGNWEVAAALVIVERMGRAIRSPIRDAMLSHASSRMGYGWGFGLHEAMDQTGAVIGPLLVAGTLGARYGYADAYAMLLLPAIVSIGLVVAARALFPRPRNFDLAPDVPTDTRLRSYFWLYIASVAIISAGYADFALVAFHFGEAGTIAAPVIPLFYAVAMAAEGIAALVLGWLFDRYGMVVVVASVLIGAIAAPLMFLGDADAALLGMVFWGVGMGAQESVVRSVVATWTKPEARATAYGLLNGFVGVSWFLGSSLLGVLYDRSVLAVALVSLGLQLLALPILLTVMFRAGPILNRVTPQNGGSAP